MHDGQLQAAGCFNRLNILKWYFSKYYQVRTYQVFPEPVTYEFFHRQFNHLIIAFIFWQSWAGEIELAALAEIYHRKVEVYHYHSNQVGLKSFGHSSPGEPSILLAYSDGNHYDSIMTKDFRNDSAICQCKVFHLFYRMHIYIPLLQPFYTSCFLSQFYNSLYQIVRIFKCTVDSRRIIQEIQV